MDLIRMLVLLPLMAFAQPQAAEPPADPPAQDAPAPKPEAPGAPEALKLDAPKPKSHATISDDAKALVDEVGKAYNDLSHLQLAGTLRLDVAIDGEAPEQHDTKFTSSFAAPNQFRHEQAGDVQLGSTGTDVYSFKAKDKNYTLAAAPKERAALSDYPPDVIQSLSSQNLSLALALSADPSAELLSDATAVSKEADSQIDGAAYPTLKIKQDDETIAILAIDPTTHLIKRIQTDLTQALKKRRPDLTSAVVSTLYTDIQTAAPEGAMSYAWAPPEGAVDAAAAAMARAGASGPSDGSQLLGKPAPAFKLPTLDAGEISLAGEKGHPVIIDFWATWCGPCRMGLPKLDAIAAAHKDDGLRVYAIDQKEDAAKVRAFVKSTNLGIPVLLDANGKIGDAYGVQGIPFTVLIAPNGQVVKVFVGYSDKESEEIEKALKPLLKKSAS